MPVHFMHWQRLFVFEPILLNVICYSEVCVCVCFRCHFVEFGFSLKSVFYLRLVCLKNLKDHGNAFLALERSVMLPDAIKNPLIYLNFSIFCWRTKRFALANANLNNFYNLANSMSVRHEVSSVVSLNCSSNKNNFHSLNLIIVQTDC